MQRCVLVLALLAVGAQACSQVYTHSRGRSLAEASAMRISVRSLAAAKPAAAHARPGGGLSMGQICSRTGAKRGPHCRMGQRQEDFLPDGAKIRTVLKLFIQLFTAAAAAVAPLWSLPSGCTCRPSPPATTTTPRPAVIGPLTTRSVGGPAAAAASHPSTCPPVRGQ